MNRKALEKEIDKILYPTEDSSNLSTDEAIANLAIKYAKSADKALKDENERLKEEVKTVGNQIALHFNDIDRQNQELEVQLAEKDKLLDRVNDKDLQFLRKMHKCSQKLLQHNDIVTLERLDKMIEDWKDELVAIKESEDK